eukprot:scaffold47_cov258-Pinguiococcus_pyrenoidosus.AAC.26
MARWAYIPLDGGFATTSRRLEGHKHDTCAWGKSSSAISLTRPLLLSDTRRTSSCAREGIESLTLRRNQDISSHTYGNQKAGEERTSFRVEFRGVRDVSSSCDLEDGLSHFDLPLKSLDGGKFEGFSRVIRPSPLPTAGVRPPVW